MKQKHTKQHVNHQNTNTNRNDTQMIHELITLVTFYSSQYPTILPLWIRTPNVTHHRRQYSSTSANRPTDDR